MKQGKARAAIILNVPCADLHHILSGKITAFGCKTRPRNLPTRIFFACNEFIHGHAKVEQTFTPGAFWQGQNAKDGYVLCSQLARRAGMNADALYRSIRIGAKPTLYVVSGVVRYPEPVNGGVAVHLKWQYMPHDVESLCYQESRRNGYVEHAAAHVADELLFMAEYGNPKPTRGKLLEIRDILETALEGRNPFGEEANNG